MPHLAPIASALLLSLALATPTRAALAPTELRISRAADASQARSTALLKQLVAQNSGTFNTAGVTAVANMLRPEFEALGFQVDFKPMPDTGRAGHLIAIHPGNGKGKRVLLIGHLDTVFEPDNPFTGFRIEGKRAFGPGVGDDKGGVVVILSALRALRDAGALQAADIEVVLTGDEEDVGMPVALARADLIAAGKRADAALDFENISHQNGREMGAVARRSSNEWTLTVHGESGHSSGIFSNAMGDGAAFELARILAAFRTELPEPDLTFTTFDANKTRLSASGKDNIVPGIALTRGDFRTLSPEQTARVSEKMRAIVSRHLPLTSANITIEEHYPPMAPTAGNRALLAKLNGINRDLGLPELGEIDPLSRGAGDIAFVARDVDGLVGMGASGGESHGPGEYIELDSLPRQAKRAALLIYRLSQTPR